MLEMKVSDILEHHGVKGQKWGIRNPESSAREAKPGSYHYAKQLDDAKLKAIIERMNLEKRYVDLNRDTSKYGNNYAVQLLKKHGHSLPDAAIAAVITAAIGVGINAGKKKLGV